MSHIARFLLGFAVFSIGALATMAVQADPPGRAGRISHVSGIVTLRSAHSGESDAAVVNWPVTGGVSMSTSAGARAEVRIGSTALRLAEESELEFLVLDDQQLRLRLLRGTAALRLLDREQAWQFEMLMPQGRVAVHDAGTYRFDGGRFGENAALTVFRGGATFSGGGLVLSARTGQKVEILDNHTPGYIVGTSSFDEFDAWSQARDRRDDETRSTRYVSREMTGYEELDSYGAWQESGEYGPVWYPRAVPVGWAPYRHGRWAWVAPWGWTWVDEAPWGFAPFHYGRWALVGGVWGWIPGPIMPRPVYAPALVAWVGRSGWQVSFSFGLAAAVGWYPLGPREVYVPGYRCSTAYLGRINAPHVTNITHIVNVQRNPHGEHHIHRGKADAVTIVPSHVMGGRSPVSGHALTPKQTQTVVLPQNGAGTSHVATPEPPRRGTQTSHDRGAVRTDNRTGERAPVPAREEMPVNRHEPGRNGQARRESEPATPARVESRGGARAPMPSREEVPAERREPRRDGEARHESGRGVRQTPELHHAPQVRSSPMGGAQRHEDFRSGEVRRAQPAEQAVMPPLRHEVQREQPSRVPDRMHSDVPRAVPPQQPPHAVEGRGVRERNGGGREEERGQQRRRDRAPGDR